MHKLDVIKHRNVFLGVALALVFAAWVCVFVFGLQPGADLSGGTSWSVQFASSTTVSPEQVRAFVEKTFHADVATERVGEGIVIRVKQMMPSDKTAYEQALTKAFGTFQTLGFSSIGPTVSKALWRQSLWALIGAIAAITFFVGWAFRKAAARVSSWKYGFSTLIALFHDVSIPLGAVALFGHFGLFDVDTTILVGLLMTVGFSVHDTIVVFDRIREHLLERKNERIPLGDIVNDSVNQTLMRSMNTSGTLIVVLIALLLFGPSSLMGFLLTVLIGTVAGTYSSIFVASPLLYLWQGRNKGD